LSTYCKGVEMEILYQTHSAKFALDWLSNQIDLPELIISDCAIPNMDGYEFAKALKKHSWFKLIKLIIVTSDFDSGTVRALQRAGFDDFLPKPIIRKELIKVLQRTLERPGSKSPILTKHNATNLMHQGLKILIVEDDITNLLILQKSLVNFGCVIDTVAHGKEAIEAIEKKQYDICFMDVFMPVMDGIEASKNIRSSGNFNLPIIAYTAAATIDDQNKCLSAGMSDFITKPLDNHQLRGILKKWGEKYCPD